MKAYAITFLVFLALALCSVAGRSLAEGAGWLK